MRKKIIISILIVGIIILAGIIVYFVANQNSVEVKSYVRIKQPVGYNGEASCLYEIDKKALATEIYEKSIFKDKNNYYKENEIDLIKKISDSYLNFSINKKNNLKNGDVIKIKVRCDNSILKKLKVSLKNNTVTYVVTGLKNYKKVDPFKNIKISYAGASPYLKIKINSGLKEINDFIFEVKGDSSNNVWEEYQLSDLYDYDTDKEVPHYYDENNFAQANSKEKYDPQIWQFDSYKNNEYITVSIKKKFIEYYKEKYGIVFSKKLKKMKLFSKNTYSIRKELINDKTLKEVKKIAKWTIDSVNGDSHNSWKDIRYVGGCFLEYNKPSENKKNKMALIYKGHADENNRGGLPAGDSFQAQIIDNVYYDNNKIAVEQPTADLQGYMEKSKEKIIKKLKNKYKSKCTIFDF